MAIPRKASTSQQFDLLGDIPNPPTLPKEFVERFEELQEYSNQYDDWWKSFRILFQRDVDQINSRFAADERRIKALEESS